MKNKQKQSKIKEKKQIDALESLKPSERLNPEIANEIERIEEKERGADRSQMVCKISNETFAQIKASNNSESLLSEIKQIVYSLYQSN